MERRSLLLLGALVVGALVVGAAIGLALDRPPGQAPRPSSAALEREERGRSLMAGVTLTVEFEQATFVAGGAVADFGIEEGVRRVIVRIAHRLDVRVTVQAADDVAFGAVPVLCLVGPDAAPDDAGLESPCWGRPDLSDFLATHLMVDEFGHPLLAGSAPTSFSATLWRGNGTCDYAPGEWELRLWADVVVDGHHTGEMVAAPTSFDVPVPGNPGPLRLVDPEDTRFCGLASRIYREQGEPETFTP